MTWVGHRAARELWCGFCLGQSTGRYANAEAPDSAVAFVGSTYRWAWKHLPLEHCLKVSSAPRRAVISLDYLIADSVMFTSFKEIRPLWNFFFFFCSKTSPSQPNWEFTAWAVFQHKFCWQNQTWVFPRLSRDLFTLTLFLLPAFKLEEGNYV